jgi:hypothetical protein
MGAYTDTVTTSEGSIKGTVVPVTLADGRKAQLLIPARSADDPHGVYMRDSNGLHPVHVSERANRNDVARAPSVVETRSDPPHAKRRSWEKDALIHWRKRRRWNTHRCCGGREKGSGGRRDSGRRWRAYLRLGDPRSGQEQVVTAAKSLCASIDINTADRRA